jgi:hypothetical protein
MDDETFVETLADVTDQMVVTLVTHNMTTRMKRLSGDRKEIRYKQQKQRRSIEKVKKEETLEEARIRCIEEQEEEGLCIFFKKRKPDFRCPNPPNKDDGLCSGCRTLQKQIEKSKLKTDQKV